MVLYIDGPINSGKTTIGKMLAQQLPRTVHIEADELRHFADCLTLDEAIPFVLDDIICLTQNWTKRGFHVVVTWPAGKEEHRILVESILPTGVDLYSFTLLPQEEICLSFRGSRQLSERESNRIREMYAWRREHGSVGQIIDNSYQTPAETVAAIMGYLYNK